MNKKLLALVSALLMLCSFVSHAAVISYSYASLDASFDPSTNLLDYYNSQISTEVLIDEFDMEGTFDDSIMNVTFTFDLASNSLFKVFAGLDAGYGAEIYINNTLVLDSANNLWWSKSWGSADVISFESFLNNGLNSVSVIWAEECCGGLSSIAFSSPLVDAGNFTTLSVSALSTLETTSPSAALSVDAPGSMAILALGLLGLVSVRKFFSI